MSPSQRAKPKRRRAPKKAPAQDPLAGPEPKPVRCVAKTAKRKRCKRTALAGTDLCSVHLGAPVGRPTKLDDALTGQLVEALEKGVPQETAVIALGIGKSTFYDWLDRGHPDGIRPDPSKPERLFRKQDEPFRVFRIRVEQALRVGERGLVESIAGASDWRAQAWLLTRLNPDEFGGTRGSKGAVHPDEFAGGEASAPKPDEVLDDQLGPDGSPL